MAPKQPCAKYQYVVTAAGPKIVPVHDVHNKDEESPADYNSGGYLPVKINDSFKDGRYLVLRKLGCVFPFRSTPSDRAFSRYRALCGRREHLTHITRSQMGTLLHRVAREG